MASKFSDKDRGYKALIARLKSKPVHITVGVHEAEGAESHGEGEDGKSTSNGATVLDVAEWMEFGTKDVPARSFIAAWVDEQQKEIEQDLQKMGKAVAAGKVPSIEIGFERLGLKFVGDIRNRIKAHIPPPLAQITIDRKGSSTPLIDTSQLWTSILHKVVKP